jgi:DNA-binding HxlR family transcriptional regulator
MKKRDVSEIVCSIARAVAEIGDTWKILIIKELFLHNLRFDAIGRQTGMSPHSLSTRLAELENDGIIERRPYQQGPTRYEYYLTEKGIDLWPMMVALNQWGDKWGSPETQEPLNISHKTCSADSRPVVVCSDCGEPMHARQAEVHMSAQSANDRATRSA